MFIQFRGSLFASNLAVVVGVLQILLEEKWVPHGDVLGSWALQDACWLRAEHGWVVQVLWTRRSDPKPQKGGEKASSVQECYCTSLCSGPRLLFLAYTKLFLRFAI